MPGVVLLSLLVPLADVPVAERQNILRGTMRALLREVAKVPTLANVDLAARALTGNDLGLTSQFWNETVSRTLGTANTYENSAINGTTERDRVIGIYGVYVASSSYDSVGSLRFSVGGRRTHQWDLQAVMADEPWRHFREQRTLVIYQGEVPGVMDPVIIPPSTGILVQHYVRGATNQGVQPSELVFLGVVLEPTAGGGAQLQLAEK